MLSAQEDNPMSVLFTGRSCASMTVQFNRHHTSSPCAHKNHQTFFNIALCPNLDIDTLALNGDLGYMLLLRYSASHIPQRLQGPWLNQSITLDGVQDGSHISSCCLCACMSAPIRARPASSLITTSSA